MNYPKNIKVMAKLMINQMTEDERDFILFIHLCDMLEQDEELYIVNEEMIEDAKKLKGGSSSKDMQNSLPDIFPAVYERLQKKL
jgi:hypothetical protein|tara:strand:+ start:199 stop:450 length:252 start_codon:yes stop_codon:yes gene_type:complete